MGLELSLPKTLKHEPKVQPQKAMIHGPTNNPDYGSRFPLQLPHLDLKSKVITVQASTFVS